ncbi:hypothetical protein [Vibrio mediterranei]|uniref:hypothetical protein n=1 Tax=Vibrio mediterranei TaxID=689 RepID=UPI004068C6EC
MLANIINTFGAASLFCAFILFSLNRRRLGYQFSTVGSALLVVSFSMFGSVQFVLLNMVWFFISVAGCFREKDKTSNESARLTSWYLLSITLFMIAGWQCGTQYLASSIVAAFLVSYALFTYRIISKFDYFYTSLLGNLLSLSYLYQIGNYSSVVHSVVTAMISVQTMIMMKVRARRSELESLTD